MSPELVKALTDLVLALTGLAKVTGNGWFAFIVLGLAALLVGVPWYREHKRNQRVDIVIKHKEEEVLRLAEDNRRYREVYLAKLGFPAEALAQDAVDSKSAKDEPARKGGRKQ